MNEDQPTPTSESTEPTHETVDVHRQTFTRTIAPDPDSFAARLKAAREAAGLSKNRAAALFKVSALTVSNWEKGRALGGSEPSPQKQGSVMRRLREQQVVVVMPPGAQEQLPDSEPGYNVQETPVSDHDPYDPVTPPEVMDQAVDAITKKTLSELEAHQSETYLRGENAVVEGAVGTRSGIHSSTPVPDPTIPPEIHDTTPVGETYTTKEGVIVRKISERVSTDGASEEFKWVVVGHVAPHPFAKKTLTGSGDTPEPKGVVTPEPAKPTAPIPANIPVGNVHTTPEGVLLRRLADDDDREGSQSLDGRLWMTVGFVSPHPRAKQPRPLVSTPPPAPPPAPQQSPQRPDSVKGATEVSHEAQEPAEAKASGKRSWAWWNQP